MQLASMIQPSVTTTPSSVLLLVVPPHTLVARSGDKAMLACPKTIKVELISSIILVGQDRLKWLN